MKRYLILIIFIISINFSGMCNESAVDSTTVNINNEWKDETDFNFYFPFKNIATKSSACNNNGASKHYPSSSVSMLNSLMFGFVGIADSPNNGTFNMGRSLEIFSPSLISVRYKISKKGPTFSLGFGLGWKNFHSQNRMKLSHKVLPDDGEIISIDSYPEGSYRRSSHIHTFSLMFPFFIKQNLSSNLKISLGAILDLNTHVCVSYKYTLDNIKYKENWKPDFRSTTYDIMAIINYQSIGWYVKYTPMSLFNKQYGPNTSSISTGIVFGEL